MHPLLRISATLLGAAAASLAIGSCSDPDSDSLLVTRSEFGDAWPLTVDSGTLSCDIRAVILEVDGVEYGVNGKAVTRGYRELRPLLLEDQGVLRDQGPLIDRGLELCDDLQD